LKEFAKQLRSKMLHVADVAEIDYLGDQNQVVYIEMSNAKLSTLGIAPQQILQALSQTNSVQSAGTIETRSTQIQLRVTGEFTSLDTIRGIGIRAGGRVFKLGDVATVSRGYVDPASYKMFFNGKPAVGVAVSMLKGGNVIRLGKSLDHIVTAT